MWLHRAPTVACSVAHTRGKYLCTTPYRNEAADAYLLITHTFICVRVRVRARVWSCTNLLADASSSFIILSGREQKKGSEEEKRNFSFSKRRRPRRPRRLKPRASPPSPRRRPRPPPKKLVWAAAAISGSPKHNSFWDFVCTRE